MRVRACTKCKKYMILRSGDSINEKKLTDFEKTHKGHSLMHVDLKEIEGTYENIEITKLELQEELKKCKSILNGIKPFNDVFGFENDEKRTQLMRAFEETADMHPGKHAIYEGKITRNYINWLEKEL